MVRPDPRPGPLVPGHFVIAGGILCPHRRQWCIVRVARALLRLIPLRGGARLLRSEWCHGGLLDQVDGYGDGRRLL
jgi:hypothetical protein